MRAQAYTIGRNIVFGRGAYDPFTSRGRHLLAHELTHVIQQRGGAASAIQRQAQDAAFASVFEETTDQETFNVGVFDAKGMAHRISFLSVLIHELCGHGVEGGADDTKGFRQAHDETIDVENKIAVQEHQLTPRGKFTNKRQGESFFVKDGDTNSVFRLGDHRPHENALCNAPKNGEKCWHYEPV
jgi:hypothetical protein